MRRKGKDIPGKLFLLVSTLGLGTVEDLEELGNASPHARVHVSLGTLDMVVEVITEELELSDGGVTDGTGSKVPGEEDKGDKVDTTGLGDLGQFGEVFELEWGLPGVKDGRGILKGELLTGIDKFLKEDLSKDPIRLFPEDGGEDDGDTVGLSTDIDGLLLTVVNGHEVGVSDLLIMLIKGPGEGSGQDEGL